jgi:cell division protein FtsI (penicillin-binding protein 3)
MTPEKKEVFFKWWQAYARHHKIPRNALFFVHDYKRAYPFGKLLGQILHTVREERDPQSRICEPTGGLELSLNKYLKGEDGQRMILRSPRQPLDVGQVIKKPRHGAHVYLTINHHLQAMAEEEIKKAVVTAQAKSGWAIVMDPYTGEILAWAQYPQFEPEKYAEYFKDPHQQEASLIKGITVPFEPGSTMKPITLALALKANLEMIRQGKPPIFDPSERIATSSGKFPGRTKPIKDLRTHKYLNFDTALQKSSNIYMGRVVERIIQHLGDEWYRTSLQTIFGFGTRTGIELPAESPGLLPMPGKKHPNGKVQWSKATPYSLAMGYNLLTNSLQMVRCYAVLANGGFDVKPTLIKKIVSHEGEVLFEQTKQSPRRCLEQEVVDRVVKAMRYVTKRGGTASRADIDHYTEAAKTSSTEKVKGGVYSKKIHISTLTGFAPAVNPRIVISIAIDEPAYGYIPGVGKNHLGGGCASPAFKAIGYQTLQYLGVPPDDPNNDSWLKEVKELEGLYQTMNQ